MAPKVIKSTPTRIGSAKVSGRIAKVRPLGEARISRQNAMSGIGMLSLLGGQRSFTVADVIFMLDDDQIALGMDYLKIPIGHAPIAVKTSKPEAYAFACDLYKRIWEKLVPKLDMYLGYGWTCLEALYKKDPQNLLYWDFSDFDIAPSLGATPWVYNDRLAFASIDLSNGFNAFQMDLGVDGIKGQIILEGAGKFRPAKALWLCNDPLLSRWYGRSVLRAAHLRWKMKNMPDGMLESMAKAMYKSSYSGILMRYPAGQSVVAEDGSIVTSEQYVDFLLQVIKNGSNIRLPAHIDGSPGWDIEEYAKNLVDMSKLMEPLDYVDRGMLRGMGIPDDIITHEGATGGFSRALVSVDAFYSRGETRAGTVLGPVTDGIAAPLIRQRYGEDCEVSAHIMPAPRPGDTDADGNGIPDALEGSMGQEQDPNGDGSPSDGSGPDDDNGNGPPAPRQQPLQGKGVQAESRFSVAMAKERAKSKKAYSFPQLASRDANFSATSFDESKHARGNDGKWTKASYGGKHQHIYKAGGEEIGEITTSTREDGHHEVSNVLVWPKHQRKGHATRFYKHAAKEAASQGKKLFISNDRTEDAKKLHEHFQKSGNLGSDGEISFKDQ